MDSVFEQWVGFVDAKIQIHSGHQHVPDRSEITEKAHQNWMKRENCGEFKSKLIQEKRFLIVISTNSVFHSFYFGIQSLDSV